MATYTFTASSVFGTSIGVANFTADAIVAGQLVYCDPTTGFWKKADNTTSAKAGLVGVALSDALSGQVLAVQTSGPVTVGSVFSGAGRVLVMSGTAGKCMNAGDLTAGFLTIVGYSISATQMMLAIDETEIEKV